MEYLGEGGSTVQPTTEESLAHRKNNREIHLSPNKGSSSWLAAKSSCGQVLKDAVAADVGRDEGPRSQTVGSHAVLMERKPRGPRRTLRARKSH